MQNISIRTPAWGVTASISIWHQIKPISIRTPAWGVTRSQSSL